MSSVSVRAWDGRGCGEGEDVDWDWDWDWGECGGARVERAFRSGVEPCGALVPREEVLPVLARATGMRVFPLARPGLLGTGSFGLESVRFLLGVALA